MVESDETFECSTCGAVATAGEARRTATMGDLDPGTWQTLCCPACGSRLKTVFVGDE
jgi:Zn finger protein HypA/HybF involved in hydrogenase expression